MTSAQQSPDDAPLVLGGHSFIRQLGSEPRPSAEEQTRIVAACLDSGIRWFDTTYAPERLALGHALSRLGRRDEATIIAWNFFQLFDPDSDDPVGGAGSYEPRHIDLILEQLRTDRIDCLVVHRYGDETEHGRQEDLARRWLAEGKVRRLGTWGPPADTAVLFGLDNPYSFMVKPWNVTTPDAAPTFAACKGLGWETLACSPFVRGWELDRLVAAHAATEGTPPAEARQDVAGLLLRFSLFQPNVDRLIVSMRQAEWVRCNVDSWRRGPLTVSERARLTGLMEASRQA